MKANRILKHSAIVVAAVVLGFPMGFIAAVISAPFWGWFESTTGIESLGHSGPDDWVFYLLFPLCMVSLFVILEIALRGGKRVETTSG
jgi:ABC-type antimicrobial peptide transport system permease subunit